MSDDKNKSNNGKKLQKERPLGELNNRNDKFTSIEIEKDPLLELEKEDKKLPEYDSKSGELIEAKESKDSAKEDDSFKEKKSSKDDKSDLMSVIDEVDVSKNVSKKTESSDEKVKAEDVKAKKSKSKKQIHVRPKKEKTKVIDNVKVDEDGVPLLNQFDGDSIKNMGFFSKFKITRRNLTKILLIVVGLIITIFGVLQSIEDVLIISDNVINGEHQSVAILLIFIGILIMILAFYREIIGLFGLSKMNKSFKDSSDVLEDDEDDN